VGVLHPHDLSEIGYDEEQAYQAHQAAQQPPSLPTPSAPSVPQPPVLLAAPHLLPDISIKGRMHAIWNQRVDPLLTKATQPTANLGGHMCSPIALWSLAVLAGTYVHMSAVSFSVPVMQPLITHSLGLSDMQSALLTSGYSYVYALALIPMGLLADKVRRPLLLGVGAGIWSALSYAASQVTSFEGLAAVRVGVATAQSAQNVVCFGLIPDLFPTNRSTALSIYNCAIYLGRGAVYLAFNAAKNMLPAADVVLKDTAGNLLVPLDKLDLRLVQVMYLSGDMAAIRASVPLYGLDSVAAVVGDSEMSDVVWRSVLEKLAFPGALLAAAVLFTVPETRRKAAEALSDSSPPAKASSTSISTTTGSLITTTDPTYSLAASHSLGAGHGTAALGSSSSGVAGGEESGHSQGGAGSSGIMQIIRNKAFMAVTLAAAFNDVASYGLIAWQSTLYGDIRGYDLEVGEYAPILATLLPLAGIVGGVGGGMLADRLTPFDKRGWITCGATLVSAPFIWGSVVAPTATQSFACLAVGFALSEAWRAPSAVMARSVAPPGLTSTAMSLYLCVRNLLGGLGPLAVAQLCTTWELRDALQVLPIMLVASAAMFAVAERVLPSHSLPIAEGPAEQSSAPIET